MPILAAWVGNLQDPSAAQIAAGAVVVQTIVVVIALLYARGQLREARAARESTERPFVVIEIDGFRRQGIAFLSITNYGRSLARKITFDFDPPLRSSWGDLQPAFVSSGLPSLAPGREIAWPFDSFIERHDARAAENPVPESYQVTISYQADHRVAPYVDHLVLDFSQFEGMTYLTERTIHDVHGELEKLRKIADNFGPSQGGVLVRSEAEIEAAAAKGREMAAAARARAEERRQRNDGGVTE